MGIFGAFKRRLKRKIRLKRRWLSLGIWALIAVAIVWQVSGVSVSVTPEPAIQTFLGQDDPLQPDYRMDKAAEVMLYTVYVCGEEVRSLGVREPEDIRRLAADHPEWEYMGIIQDKATFETHVDDLSTDCKENSYFGMDAFGNLTLFDGPPAQEKAMKTFFQLDVKFLESSLPEEVVKDLRQGIRIRDISEYNSVLSTFSDYAVDETEKVMKTQE
jgi:forespore regulator of the sigma-K checkpoint